MQNLHSAPRVYVRYLFLAILFLASTSALSSPNAEGICWEPEEGIIYDKVNTIALLDRLRSEESFDELESMMGCLRESTRLFPDGTPGESAIYESISNGVFKTINLEDYKYILEQWRLEKPESIFVEFSRMKFLYDTAWRALGKRTFGEATDNAKLIMIRRLLKAFPAISKPSPQLRNTRLWHQLMLSILLDLDPKGEKARAFFLQAVSRWPRYLPFYEIYAPRKTPSWNGTWEGVDHSILEWIEALRGFEGEGTYARLYIAAIGTEHPPANTLIDWEVMKHSLEALLDKHPTHKFKNFSLSLACYYEDIKFAKRLVDRYKPKYLERIYWVKGSSARKCLGRYLGLRPSDFAKQK